MIYGNKFLKPLNEVGQWVKDIIERDKIQSVKFPYQYKDIDWRSLLEDVLDCLVTDQELINNFNDLKKKEEAGKLSEDYIDKMYPDILFNVSKSVNMKKYFGNEIDSNEFSKKFREITKKDNFIKEYEYENIITFNDISEGKEFFKKNYKTIDYLERLYDYIGGKHGMAMISYRLNTLRWTADEYNKNNQKDENCKQTIAIVRKVRTDCSNLWSFATRKMGGPISDYYDKLFVIFDYFTREE